MTPQIKEESMTQKKRMGYKRENERNRKGTSKKNNIEK
jgi:hypothetical protein